MDAPYIWSPQPIFFYLRDPNLALMRAGKIDPKSVQPL